MRVRVVSWNVHGCVGADGRFHPERTVETLGLLAPDVALLQEVGDNRGVHPPIDQASTLANALGLFCTVGITLRASVHGYGNVTLSRLPVLDSEPLDLSVSGREPRLALRVVVGRESLRLTTLNVHLGLGASERRAQLRQLLPALYEGAWDAGGRVREPLVMGGDFNDFPPGPVTFTLRDRLLDAGAQLWRKRTFPSRAPLLRLDRIYHSPGVQRVHAWVDRSTHARAASDHLPLVVDLEVPEPAQQPWLDPP